MDLMQMAGHLSLEFDATVTGPWHTDGPQAMAHVTRPDGYGVALLMGPGKGQAPESRPGGLDVWYIRETGEPGKVDMSNTYDMIHFDTDLDGAREALRTVGPDTWASLDVDNARKYGIRR
jgi:hypothetical protein